MFFVCLFPVPCFSTTFFESGWENSGGSDVTDDGAWTGTSGSPSVVGSPVHHGSYAMECQQGDYVTTTFDMSTVFVRMYVRFSALPVSAWQSNPFGRLRHTSSPATDLVYFGIRQQASGVYGWYLGSLVPSAVTGFNESSLSVDTWYCIEIKYVSDSVNGEYLMYVNGDLVLSRTGVDTATSGGNAELFYCGGWSTLADDLDIDCVVASDVYIGVEGGGSPQNVFVVCSESLGVSSGLASWKCIYRGSSVTCGFECGLTSRKVMYYSSGSTVVVSSIVETKKSIFAGLVLSVFEVVDLGGFVDFFTSVLPDFNFEEFGWEIFAMSVLLCMAFSFLLFFIVYRGRRGD